MKKKEGTKRKREERKRKLRTKKVNLTLDLLKDLVIGAVLTRREREGPSEMNTQGKLNEEWKHRGGGGGGEEDGRRKRERKRAKEVLTGAI